MGRKRHSYPPISPYRWYCKLWPRIADAFRYIKHNLIGYHQHHLSFTHPYVLGRDHHLLEVSRGMKVNYGNLAKGYHDFTRIFLTILLKGVYTFLWALLLIIPGIVKSYSYAMTEFVLADRPDLAYNEAIEESMRLMQGNKWRLFVLDLSFLGWALLCILTLGIGYLFLAPYMEVAHAHFYADLKADDQEFSDDTITIETI